RRVPRSCTARPLINARDTCISKLIGRQYITDPFLEHHSVCLLGCKCLCLFVSVFFFFFLISCPLSLIFFSIGVYIINYFFNFFFHLLNQLLTVRFTTMSF